MERESHPSGVDGKNAPTVSRKTDALLLRLLAAGLHAAAPVDTEGIPETDAGLWQRVYRLSAAQGVLAIAYDAALRLPAALRPPKEVLIPWAVNTDRIEREYTRREEALGALAAFYARHGMRMMLLKGAGLASLYPIPQHRPCGDIDIWLYGRQREADRLTERELNIRIDRSAHHHTIFSCKGVLVENHFDFLNVWSHRSNRRLERYLRRYATEEGRPLIVGQQHVWLPSPDFNALYLMRHMAVHFAAVEIGLRHIADWALFLKAEGDRVRWDEIRSIYRRENMDRFADAVTALCVERLGIPAAKAYDYAHDSALQERILHETLHPAFAEKCPRGSLLAPALFKFRRWWANRWKHRLVYRDSLAGSFVWLCWAHLIRPKTLIK